MPKAICEDCGSMVEAELTHNGICAVGHYVHCGCGHELLIEGFISDDIVKLITRLEAKLTDAADVIEWALICWDDHNKHGHNMQGDWVPDARATLAELTGDKDE